MTPTAAHDEEDETTIFLDRVRIASAAWMPLLLSKRSTRQREQRELRELRGGGLLSAITGEKRVGMLVVAVAAPEIIMNV
jgi:hypothetical protein